MAAERGHPRCPKCCQFLSLPSSPAGGHVAVLTGSGEALLGGQPEEGWVECILEQSLSGQQRARLSSDTLGKVTHMTVPK